MQFSVIVPIYNVEQYIRDCLDSVLNQTFTDFEAILVDDGSTDNCPEIIDEYAKKDSRIKVIHKENGGLVSARNAGLFAASGDYICYVDGDDRAKPDMLRFIHDILEEFGPLDMVLFAADNVHDGYIDQTFNNVEGGFYDKKRLTENVYPYLLSDRRNGFHGGYMIHAHTWDKAIKRDLHLKHYCRDESIRMFTDVAFVYECMLDSDSMYICNKSLYLYNKMNESSLTAGKRHYLTKSFYHLCSYLKAHLSGYNMDSQTNDYPALIVIRAILQEIHTQEDFKIAVRTIKNDLKDCGILNLINVWKLPIKPGLLMLLLKLNLYTFAMWLCKKR